MREITRLVLPPIRHPDIQTVAANQACRPHGTNASGGLCRQCIRLFC